MSESASKSASPTSEEMGPPPVRRQFWKQVLLSLVIFTSGAIVGTCATLMLIRQQVHHRIHHPEEMPGRVASHIQRKLDLSDEQTKQVETIVAERQQDILQIRREFQPRLETQLDQLEKQVAHLLDNSQSKTWHERFQALRAEWLPPVPQTELQ